MYKICGFFVGLKFWGLEYKTHTQIFMIFIFAWSAICMQTKTLASILGESENVEKQSDRIQISLFHYFRIQVFEALAVLKFE